MKLHILSLLIIIPLLFGCSSTKKSSKNFFRTPKDMTFIPPGELTVIKDSVEKTVSINAFWISNEITNKEFREFVNDLQNNPDSSIYVVNLNQAAKINRRCTPQNFGNEEANEKLEEDLKNHADSTANERYAYYIKLNFADMLTDLIDYSVWDDNDDFANYFYDKNFDNYPIVGITNMSAQYYCMWRTSRELNKNFVHLGFRLPKEEEWEYAALANSSNMPEFNGNHKISVANKGVKNDFDLINMNSNVSEFVNSDGCEDCVIIMGNSWKEPHKNEIKSIKPENFRDNATGFRVVMTYLAD